MPEIQLGVHTIRSHGARVARIHMHDWLILLLLVIIDGVLNIIEPFHRFVGEGMMMDLRYPLKDNTIPFWAVPVCFYFYFFCRLFQYVLRPWISHKKFEIMLCLRLTWLTFKIINCWISISEQIIAILLPLAVILVYYFLRKDVYDFHHAILGAYLKLKSFPSFLFPHCHTS